MLVGTNCAKSYASPIFQSVLENAGDATMHNSLNPLPQKLGIKSLSYLQTITLIIYAANLHNCMILSETSVEELPRRRRQIIIKKCPRELCSPFADHPSNEVNFEKPVQAFWETAETGSQNKKKKQKNRSQLSSSLKNTSLHHIFQEFFLFLHFCKS